MAERTSMFVSDWLRLYQDRDLVPSWGEPKSDQYWYEKLRSVPEHLCMPEVEEDL